MSNPTPEGERTLPRIPELSHIAFVVDDLEASMRRFDRYIGIGPWLIWEYKPPRFQYRTYRGEPSEYTMRVALSDVKGPIDISTKSVSPQGIQRFMTWLAGVRDRLTGSGPKRPGEDSFLHSLPTPGMPGVNIELIEPMRGESTYTDAFARDHRGIHHIGCFAYDNPYAVVDAYENAGIDVVQHGTFEGLEFWYLDLTDELDGMLFEIAANVESLQPPDDVFPRRGETGVRGQRDEQLFLRNR